MVWAWGEKEQRAFEKAKSMLCSETLLAHFDSTKEIMLSCNASCYGISAVLAHVNSDGSEAPIA